MPPVIALTCDRRELGPAPRSKRIRPARPEIYVKEVLVQQVLGAGGIPVLIPPIGGDPIPMCDWILKACDGVIITGGAFDIDPRHYGQTVQGRLDRVDEARTGLELALAGRCIDANVPLLGICGGMQVMAVAAGGSLIQDIAQGNPDALDHEQPNDPAQTSHLVSFSSAAYINIFGSKSIRVNSTHHQAVDRLGPFVASGHAPDRTIEAIELEASNFCLGVQWHPELLDDRLVFALVRAAEDYR